MTFQLRRGAERPQRVERARVAGLEHVLVDLPPAIEGSASLVFASRRL
jgi:hypothetical protein